MYRFVIGDTDKRITLLNINEFTKKNVSTVMFPYLLHTEY